MKLFKQVAIVGTGLVGGSLALAIKKKRLAGEVVGVSRHRRSIWLAKKRGAIDRGSQELDIIKDADLVVLSMPVGAIMELSPKIARIIKKDCLVTDVGSTKAAIVARLEKCFKNYLGSHPLAGSEKRGIANAGAGLFKDSLCILTPTGKTPKRVLRKMELFWQALGAKTSVIDPAAHDKALSFTSHLPHVAAFSLIDTVPSGFAKLSSTGLRDTTRIAASDSELWSEIFLSNAGALIRAIDGYIKNLRRTRSALKSRDKRALTRILARAKEKRTRLL
ncbi:MAG: prephenate dehydrogenase [Candidatus Omnitrophica bacterium]|nr:prephenate dehydrogenase [Candidatus Omnitrophota bacterium]